MQMLFFYVKFQLLHLIYHNIIIIILIHFNPMYVDRYIVVCISDRSLFQLKLLMDCNISIKKFANFHSSLIITLL